MQWRQDRWDNAQDRWKDRHDRWNDRWRDHYRHHYHWHHGHGYFDHWRPGSYWKYWWDNYPVLTAFGVTTWAVNRIGWAFGYYRYSNPYATSSTVVVDNSTYDYSQPLVMYPDEQTLAGDPNDTSLPPSVAEGALSTFDKARQEFYAGNYEAALTSVNAALKEMPNDAVVHEFRALVLFALGKYNDAAATLYAVLSAGPGWDWTTMSGLYPNVSVYTEQLRALEAFRNSHENDPAARLVVAYHYLTAGHEDAAKRQLQKLLELTPQDPLATQLLLQLDPEAKVPTPPKQVQPPKAEGEIDKSALIGAWTSKRQDGSQFGMTLKESDDFEWSFTEGGETQTVTGVWGVDKEGILALEMNDEDAMLAQVILTDGTLDFYMLGDTQGLEPLKFTK